MQVPINYLAVVAVAVVSMVLGFLWYGPIFGKQWMALMGITPESISKAKKAGMTKNYIIMMGSALIMSYVLSHLLIFASAYMNVSGVSAGLSTGFWNWLGFIVPVTLGSVLWEGKSWKLWALNSGYYLCSLLMMGVILALWK